MPIRMMAVHTSIKLNDGQLFQKANTCLNDIIIHEIVQ